jgi:putative ABC transport system permease protein
MAIFENFRQALLSLRSNPLRSVLTLVGIAVGIVAVLYVVMLGEATQQRINSSLESLGVNVLSIRPGYSRMGGVRTATKRVNLTWDDAREINDASDVVIATVPVTSENGMVKFEDKNWSTRITGTTPPYSPVNNSKIAEGRFFNETELRDRAQVCIIGATVHTELFGDKSPVGKSIYIKSKKFEVVGLLEAKGESWFNPDDQVFIPLTTAQERITGRDNVSEILAQLDKSDSYEEALFDIEFILRRNHRLTDEKPNDFRVRRQDFYLSAIQDTNVELANFIILIALISLFVGGIGIANVMLVSVTERVREIGIRRAVGANRLTIMTQFLTEAITLGLVGGILGIGGGILVNTFVIGGDLLLPWFWIGNSALICMVIGVFSGLYPALRAARVNVIEALHHE